MIEREEKTYCPKCGKEMHYLGRQVDPFGYWFHTHMCKKCKIECVENYKGKKYYYL